MTIEGEIVAMSWANPHVSIELRDADGQVWKLEAGSLMTLQRSGIVRDPFNEGDRVRATLAAKLYVADLGWDRTVSTTTWETNLEAVTTLAAP